MRLSRRRLPHVLAAVSIAAVAAGSGVHMHTRVAAAGYSKPFTSSWTQDGSYPWGPASPRAFDATLTFTWIPDGAAAGWAGHSLARAHVTMNPDGTGAFTAYELFIGTVDGRAGEAVLYNEGTITNFVDYRGTGYCLSGAEGLVGIQCFATSVGMINVGGHTTGGSYQLP
jgi:hypothetical protein